MPAVYANDWAGITAGENAQGQLRQQALQAAMQNFQAGMASYQHSRESQRDYLLRAQQERQQTKAETRRALAEERRNQISQGYLDLAREQFKEGSPAKSREYDINFSRAQTDAEAGRSIDPEDYTRLYGLHPEHAQVLAARAVDARKNIEADYQTAANAADLINRRDLVSSYIPLSKEAVKDNSHWYNSGLMKYVLPAVTGGAINPSSDVADTETANIQDWQNELRDLNPKIQKLDKRTMSLVTYDPSQERYVPSVPAPSWQSRGGGSRSLVKSYAPTAAPATRPPGPVVIRDEPPAPMISGPQGAAPAGAGAGRMHPDFYSRVNHLISNQGMDPVSAKRQAMAEWQELFGQ